MKKSIKFIIILLGLFIFPISGQATQSANNWRSVIQFSGNNRSSHIVFGVDITATIDFDNKVGLDSIVPLVASGGEYIQGLFYHIGWENDVWRDIYYPSYPAVWNFEIESTLPSNTIITLNWANIPLGGDFALLDVLTNTLIDMTQIDSYPYPNNYNNPRRFSITVAGVYIPGDSDNDGMNDTWEMDEFGNLTSAYCDPANINSTTCSDIDGDGLLDYYELIQGTDPNLSDTDSDGVDDATEVTNGTNPLDASDNKPTANAGLNITTGPTLITLDGSNSTDPNNDTLTYKWTEDMTTIDGDEVNPEPVVGFNDTAAIQAFNLIKSGRYKFSLQVYDSKVWSEVDEVEIQINNIAPVVDAGSYVPVESGTTVILDGSGSTDANNDTLTYQWIQDILDPLKEVILTVDPNDETKASFTPVKSGVYTFWLLVGDGVNFSYESVNIVVNAQNIVPTANAGYNVESYTGEVVILNGAGSDGGGDGPAPLAFTWEQIPSIDVPLVTITGANTATPSFTPGEAGIYTFRLQVFDGIDSSLWNEVTITVNDMINNVPVAVASAWYLDEGGNALFMNQQGELIVKTGTEIYLTGMMSFDEDIEDNPILTYEWFQTGGPSVALTDATSIDSFFIPITRGDVTFELVAFDGKDHSSPSSLTIKIIPAINLPPVAYAGADFVELVGNNITINGSGSDPDDYPGNGITYNWTLGANTKTATLLGADTATPTFTPTVSGIYRYILTVNDGELDSTPDEVVITVNTLENNMPIAVAKAERIVKIGDTVLLDGSDSTDEDGNLLTYQWSKKRGKKIDLNNDTEMIANFIPRKKGKYSFKLIVNDGKIDSLPVKIKIYVIKKKGKKIKIKSKKDTKFKIGDIIIEVPAGAVDEDVEIGSTIEYDDDYDYDDDDYDYDSHSLEEKLNFITDAVDLVPKGMKFHKKIKIQFPALHKKHTLGVSSASAELAAYQYRQETEEWHYVTDVQTTEEGKISLNVSDLSHFVIAQKIKQETVEDDSSPPTDDLISVSVSSVDGKSNEDGGCFISIIGD